MNILAFAYSDRKIAAIALLWGAFIAIGVATPINTRRIPGYDRRTSAAIVRAQNELAFRKWRVQHQEQNVETDTLVSSWRDKLMRLRKANQMIAGIRNQE